MSGENMAKPSDVPVDEPSSAPDLLLTFRDKVYTSRTLILPRIKRSLAVIKGRVEVSASDEQAISYLKTNPEFEPLKE
jgi:hypothetical protein